MSIRFIDDTVFRWHHALFLDLVAGHIQPVQFLAGIDAANAWGIQRLADVIREAVQPCNTTSLELA